MTYEKDLENPQHNPSYLGDGAYVSSPPDGTAIWTDREENGRNWIILGDQEMTELIHYLEQTRNLKITVDKLEENETDHE